MGIVRDRGTKDDALRDAEARLWAEDGNDPEPPPMTARSTLGPATAPPPGEGRSRTRRSVLLGAGGAAAAALVLGAGGSAAYAALRSGPPARRFRIGARHPDFASSQKPQQVLFPEHGLAIVRFRATYRVQEAMHAVYGDVFHDSIRFGTFALSLESSYLASGVAFCASSGWWEDPRFAGQYSQVGELLDGPGERGLDRWPLVYERFHGEITLTADLGVKPLPGPPRGTNTTQVPIAGPHCA